jgi:hypothetical protein
MFKRYTPTLIAVCGALMLFATPAGARVAAPGWRMVAATMPTNLTPGTENAEVDVIVFNSGGVVNASPATLTVELPPGLSLNGRVEDAGYESSLGECTGTTTVSCALERVEPEAATHRAGPTTIFIPVKVAANASGHAEARVSITGGGAPEAAHASVSVNYSATVAGPGFSLFEAWASNIDGTTDTQAGSHPYEATFVYSLNSVVVGNLRRPNGSHEGQQERVSGAEARDVEFRLPAGVIGNPQAVPQCTRAVFDGEGCPSSTQIGVDDPGVGAFDPDFPIPIYNLVPPPGDAALFAFTFNGTPTFIEAHVRSGGDDGITEDVNNIPQEKVITNTATFWGDPAEHNGGGAPPAPFLTLPTSCKGPQESELFLRGSWGYSERTAHIDATTSYSDGTPTGFTGCERLAHFEPSVTIAPDTSRADTPAGLTTTVTVPQNVNPEGLATAGLRDTTVVLPEGIAINPGQATGLAACQAGPGPGEDDLPRAGEDAESEEFDGPPQCPAASKVGEVEISTPVLRDRLRGNVYVLQSNPPELKVLVAASADGVNLKLVGTVHLNETTGQITTTFENTPDAPLNEFKLSFSGGAQAALVTPPTCRVYNTSSSLTPWSGLQNALVEGNFTIDSGPDGAPCANPLPFSPTLTAGATTDQAGGFTDFSMLLQRPDGQQRVSRLSFKTPEGLLGMIANVPLCPEPQASEGTCPEASEIGHSIVGAGPGPYPLFIPEAGQPPAPIYLTGGYDGAPYGLSIVVPIHAGPFTLQTQIVRAKIEVDPHTAQLTVTTDPLPTIIDGIPADMRSINAVIDRPGFMFNPTDCNPASFSGTATSTEGVTVPISSPFQVGSCQALTFKPDFKVATAGTVSKVDGASLDAKIVYPPTPLGANQASSQSNIATVKVELPKQLPSRLSTLQKACLAVVFEANPANCPAASVVGHATAVTPVLPVALTGPAYFVSHGGEAFPSLIVVLQGYGVTVDLVGTTYISKAGITSSTFKQVPDVPIHSFELTLPQGPDSALAGNTPANANGSFCTSTLRMPTYFTAQNGATLQQSTPIEVEGCSAKLSIAGHRVHKRTLILTVYVPAAGKLTASGRNLSKVSKTSKARETLTVTLRATKRGRLDTHVKLTYTPKTGKKQALAGL